MSDDTVANEDTHDDKYVKVIDEGLQHEDLRKLFVSDIPSAVTDDEFQQVLVTVADSGDADDTLEGFKVIRKPNMKYCYAFVMFTKSEVLDKVLLKRDQLRTGSQTWNAIRSMPKQIGDNKDRVTKMFLANIPYHDCTEDELREYFADRHPKCFGTIEKLDLVKEKLFEGMYRNKGFGFLEVSSEDLCDKMAILHAKFEFKGRSMQLRKSYSLGQGGGKIPEMWQNEQQREQQRKWEKQQRDEDLAAIPSNYPVDGGRRGGRGRQRKQGRLARLNDGMIGVDAKGWSPKCILAADAPYSLLAPGQGGGHPGGHRGGHFMYVPTAPARYQPY